MTEPTNPIARAFEHIVAAFAHAAVLTRDSFGRSRFAEELDEATTGRTEDAPPLPVHIRLGVGEHPLRPVATAYVAGPGSASATVADALHALADEIHPPAATESVADLIRRKAAAEMRGASAPVVYIDEAPKATAEDEDQEDDR